MLARDNQIPEWLKFSVKRNARLETRRHVGRHIFAVGVAAGEREAEIAIALEVRNLIEQAEALLEQAVGAAQ